MRAFWLLSKINGMCMCVCVCVCVSAANSSPASRRLLDR